MQTETVETQYGAMSVSRCGAGKTVYRYFADEQPDSQEESFADFLVNLLKPRDTPLVIQGMLEPGEDPEDFKAYAESLGYGVELSGFKGDEPTKFETNLGTKSPDGLTSFVVCYHTKEDFQPAAVFGSNGVVEEELDFKPEAFETISSSEFSPSIQELLCEGPCGQDAVKVYGCDEAQSATAWDFPDLFWKTPSGVIKPVYPDAYAAVSFMYNITHDSSGLYEMTKEGMDLRYDLNKKIATVIRPTLIKTIDKVKTVTPIRLLNTIDAVLLRYAKEKSYTIQDFVELGDTLRSYKFSKAPSEIFTGLQKIFPNGKIDVNAGKDPGADIIGKVKSLDLAEPKTPNNTL